MKTKVLAVAICLVKMMLLPALSLAGKASDSMFSGKFPVHDTTVIPKVRTIGLSLLGNSLVGPGFTYDQSFLNKEKGYFYWRGILSNPIFLDQYIAPLAGAGYCRAITKNKQLFLGAGINAGIWIALYPTPRALRDYWDSIGFYGGYYVNPIEFVLTPELSAGYMNTRWFAKVQYTPFIPYIRVGKNEFEFYHWAGLTVGFRLKNKETKSPER